MTIAEAIGEEVPRAAKRRRRRDDRPRFKRDVSRQLDGVAGCPELLVEAGHLARGVGDVVLLLDLSEIESRYSSLGRHGYRPRHVLAVLIYASLIGIHHSTKMALMLRTDAAFRLLSGGHAISAPTLRRFRQRNAGFFRKALEQTVAMAHELGLISKQEIAVDSMRLRAYASTKAVRTLVRSKARLAELALIDTARLSAEDLFLHEAKVAKHRDAVERCERQRVASVVVTNSAAAMMKFPESGGLPGHRITVASSGVKSRVVVSVLVDADTQDYGKAGPVLTEARRVLEAAGVTGTIQAAADAGYCSEADLVFAQENRDWVDLLIAERNTAEQSRPFFTHERFVHLEDGTVLCPAGRAMHGPQSRGIFLAWTGVGCGSCDLHPRCTKAPIRSYTVQPRFHAAVNAMRTRMSQPGAQDRYNMRMATIEPVFSSVESVMGYRRATTRHAANLEAEILLKLLAHNVGRLIAARPLNCVSCVWIDSNQPCDVACGNHRVIDAYPHILHRGIGGILGWIAAPEAALGAVREAEGDEECDQRDSGAEADETGSRAEHPRT